MRSCAAQERMKMTLEKKLDNVCDFLAPVRFQSHLPVLLKTLISIEKYHLFSKNVRSCAVQECMKMTL